ncbi:MAG: PaaI family thioesterase [Pseudomonadota bacterium]
MHTPSGVPAGFEPIPTRGQFTDLNGPIWRQTEPFGTPARLGFLPEARHTNTLGFVHGGMLSTVLDSAMAHVAHDRFQCRLVTLSLNLTFHHAVFKGRWADILVEFTEQSDTLIGMKASLTARKSVCVSAVAEYRLFPSSKA